MQDYIIDPKQILKEEESKMWNSKPVFYNRKHRKWEFKSKVIMPLFGL